MNVIADEPSLFFMRRAGDDSQPDGPPTVVEVSANFYEASRWMDAGESVERLPLPARAGPAADAAEEIPLADPATLSLADDFSAFLRAKVPEALKRQAMRQLFSQAHFKVVDGLEVYMEGSSSLIPRDNGDCSMCSRSAACAKCNSLL